MNSHPVLEALQALIRDAERVETRSDLDALTRRLRALRAPLELLVHERDARQPECVKWHAKTAPI